LLKKSNSKSEISFNKTTTTTNTFSNKNINSSLNNTEYSSKKCTTNYIITKEEIDLIIEDLYKPKKILKKSKSFKCINNNKNNDKNNKNNNILTNSISNLKNFSIYSKNNNLNNNNNFYLTTDPNFYSNSIISNNKKLNKNYSLNLINSHLSLKVEKDKYSFSEFIKKSKEVLKQKYIIQLKKERYKTLIDLKENKIDCLYQLNENLKNQKDLYDKNYMLKYVYYLKHLNNLIKSEKIQSQKNLEKINLQRKELEILELKIIEKKKELFYIENWYTFLLEVKFKKKFQNINIKEEKYKIYKNELIFFSVEDFYNQYQYLINENLNLLMRYNEIKQEVYELKKERENEYNNIHTNNDYIVKEISIKEKEYDELKTTNDQLEYEKNLKIKKMKKCKKFWLDNIKYSKIPYKINNLYELIKKVNKRDNLVEFDIFIFNNTLIKKLRTIEKFLNEIKRRINEYYKINKQLYQKVISKLHKYHHMKKIEEEKIIEKKRIDKLRENLENKKSKVYFVPHKRIDIYFERNMKVIEKRKRVYSQEKIRMLKELNELKKSKSISNLIEF